MVAFNFTVFVDQIKDGRKRQTIRKKARCKPGDKLQLYTGMRSSLCTKIGDAICKSVSEIVIDVDYVAVDGFRLASGDVIDLAQRDGFSGPIAFKGFFLDKYDLPFHGHIIRWRDFRPTPTGEA